MFCPRCGQEQISEETSFCSRCGFMLTMVAEIIANGGVLPQSLAGSKNQKISTPRKKGLKQGLFILMLTFLFVPLAGFLLNDADVAAAIGVLFLVGGLLRMAYAVMFQSNAGDPAIDGMLPFTGQNILTQTPQANRLSPQQNDPVSSYVPPIAKKLNETNDLAFQPPPSVTDHTTKLLHKDE